MDMRKRNAYLRRDGPQRKYFLRCGMIFLPP
jgi:hypothetical protein